MTQIKQLEDDITRINYLKTEVLLASGSCYAQSAAALLGLEADRLQRVLAEARQEVTP